MSWLAVVFVVVVVLAVVVFVEVFIVVVRSLLFAAVVVVAVLVLQRASIFCFRRLKVVIDFSFRGWGLLPNNCAKRAWDTQREFLMIAPKVLKPKDNLRGLDVTRYLLQSARMMVASFPFRLPFPQGRKGSW